MNLLLAVELLDGLEAEGGGLVLRARREALERRVEADARHPVLVNLPPHDRPAPRNTYTTHEIRGDESRTEQWTPQRRAGQLTLGLYTVLVVS